MKPVLVSFLGRYYTPRGDEIEKEKKKNENKEKYKF